MIFFQSRTPSYSKHEHFHSTENNKKRQVSYIKLKNNFSLNTSLINSLPGIIHPYHPVQ